MPSNTSLSTLDISLKSNPPQTNPVHGILVGADLFEALLRATPKRVTLKKYAVCGEAFPFDVQTLDGNWPIQVSLDLQPSEWRY